MTCKHLFYNFTSISLHIFLTFKIFCLSWFFDQLFLSSLRSSLTESSCAQQAAQWLWTFNYRISSDNLTAFPNTQMRAISAVWFRAIMKWQLLLIVLNFSRQLSCFNFPPHYYWNATDLKKGQQKERKYLRSAAEKEELRTTVLLQGRYCFQTREGCCGFSLTGDSFCVSRNWTQFRGLKPKKKNKNWDGSVRRDEDIAQQAWIKAEEVMSTTLLYLNMLSYVSGALQMTVATDCC